MPIAYHDSDRIATDYRMMSLHDTETHMSAVILRFPLRPSGPVVPADGAESFGNAWRLAPDTGGPGPGGPNPGRCRRQGDRPRSGA